MRRGRSDGCRRALFRPPEGKHRRLELEARPDPETVIDRRRGLIAEAVFPAAELVTRGQQGVAAHRDLDPEPGMLRPLASKARLGRAQPLEPPQPYVQAT